MSVAYTSNPQSANKRGSGETPQPGNHNVVLCCVRSVRINSPSFGNEKLPALSVYCEYSLGEDNKAL